MTSRTTLTSLLVLFAASTVAAASCGGTDTKAPPPPSVATSTGVTTGEFVTATTGTGGAGGMGGMGSTGSAGGGGTGGMAGCMDASECPGMKSECQTPICLAGVCDTFYPTVNTQLQTQTVGDCKVVVCDGAGATKSIEDEQDPFDDKDPCTYDLCVAGATTHPFADVGIPCGGGKVCDGKGACI